MKLVDNIWLRPTGGVFKSKVTGLAVVIAKVFRHNEISRTLAENLITIMSWIRGILEKVLAGSGLTKIYGN